MGLESWLHFAGTQSIVTVMYYLPDGDNVNVFLRVGTGTPVLIATLPKRNSISLSGSVSGDIGPGLGSLFAQETIGYVNLFGGPGSFVLDDEREAVASGSAVISSAYTAYHASGSLTGSENTRVSSSLILASNSFDIAQYDGSTLLNSAFLAWGSSQGYLALSGSGSTNEVVISIDSAGSDAANETLTATMSLSGLSNTLRVEYLTKTANSLYFALYYEQASSTSPLSATDTWQRLIYGSLGQQIETTRPSLPTALTGDHLYSELNYGNGDDSSNRDNRLPDGRLIVVDSNLNVFPGAGDVTLQVSVYESGTFVEATEVQTQGVPSNATVIAAVVYL